MKMPMDYRASLLLGGAFLAFAASPAAAQDPAQQAPASDSAAAPVQQPSVQPASAQPAAAPEQVAIADQAAGAQPDQHGLGDIVVTALRRETNLQRTPLSISVLGTQAMADRHVQALGDLADGAIPSLRVATFEARNSAL